MTNTLSRLTATLAVVILISGCGGGGDAPGLTAPPGNTPAVASIAVSLSASSLTVGTSATATSMLRSSTGALLTGRAVAWSSSATAVVTVDSDGVILAVSTGTATITATSDGKSGSATITVTPAAVASVTLSTGSFLLPAGDVQTIIATARDAQGNVLPGRTVTWWAKNWNAVDGFSFGETAVITGLQSGTAEFSAEVEGREAGLTVTVVASTVNVCTAIAGASLEAADGRYLGRFTNRLDAESVLNRSGQYGSELAAFSTTNAFGTYGSPYSSHSARNPFTSTPPVIMKDGQAIAFYTVNSSRTPMVAPAYALTCDFP